MNLDILTSSDFLRQLGFIVFGCALVVNKTESNFTAWVFSIYGSLIPLVIVIALLIYHIGGRG